MQLLEGKPILDQEKELLTKFISNMNRRPIVAIITNEDDPASKIYVKNKKKDLEECDVEVSILDWKQLINKYSTNEIENLIFDMQKYVDGLMFQLPLPEDCPFTIREIKENLLLEDKDIDGFLGKLLPCTPLGIQFMLDHYNIDVTSMNAVVIGRSVEVGKPLADMLTDMNATVTICHSKTKNLSEYTKKADIIFSAVGKKDLITQDMVNENTIIIDIGINHNEEGKLCGDCSKDLQVKAISPVPGGVGLTTRAGLLANVRECIARKYL